MFILSYFYFTASHSIAAVEYYWEGISSLLDNRLLIACNPYVVGTLNQSKRAHTLNEGDHIFYRIQSESKQISSREKIFTYML